MTTAALIRSTFTLGRCSAKGCKHSTRSESVAFSAECPDDPTDTTTSGSEMARRYALSNARAVLEAALRPQSTERARWWRVSFHLWAAGGGLIPTSGCVVARSPEQAIEKAQAASDQRDRKLGRAKCGYFKDATAEPTAEPWRTDR
jgi:hypothetical protein